MPWYLKTSENYIFKFDGYEKSVISWKNYIRKIILKFFELFFLKLKQSYFEFYDKERQPNNANRKMKSVEGTCILKVDREYELGVKSPQTKRFTIQPAVTGGRKPDMRSQ